MINLLPCEDMKKHGVGDAGCSSLKCAVSEKALNRAVKWRLLFAVINLLQKKLL